MHRNVKPLVLGRNFWERVYPAHTTPHWCFLHYLLTLSFCSNILDNSLLRHTSLNDIKQFLVDSNSPMDARTLSFVLTPPNSHTCAFTVARYMGVRVHGGPQHGGQHLLQFGGFHDPRVGIQHPLQPSQGCHGASSENTADISVVSWQQCHVRSASDGTRSNPNFQLSSPTGDSIGQC